jgi:hypothetical protein
MTRGQLKNGNPSGNPATVPRCGTRSRGGQPCRAPAVKGKRRCRMHGGLSTGPRTAEGLERSRRARWTHGRYSREAIRVRRVARANRITLEAAKARIERDDRALRDFLRQVRLID